MVLGYWNIRGLGQPVKYLLGYLGVDYELKTYEITDDKATGRSWRDVKPNHGFDFPNLPYLIDTDGFHLSEHIPIMIYIAEKYCPELRGETPEDRATILMLQNILLETRFSFVDKAKDPNTDIEEFRKEAPKNYERLGKWMQGKKYLLGDKLSILDFHMYDNLLFFCNYWSPDLLLEMYPDLHAFVKTMGSMEQIKAYHASDKYCADFPFTMRWMKINAKPEFTGCD